MSLPGETKAREALARWGQALWSRGYVHGASGNLSCRLEDGFLITPTNCCLGMLDPAEIAKVDPAGTHLGGGKQSKEGFLHLSVYEMRPAATGIVHTHSTHSVAVSCLADADPANVLEPITAYHVMKVGKLPLVPYFRPGDRALADAVREMAADHAAVLLANHGPVVAGKSIEDAVFALEELEETAKLHFLLEGRNKRLLTPAQIAELDRAFPS